MSLSDIFPDEIVQNILVKLPSKSLLKFRCVSALWLSLIHDPTFIRSHLDHNTRCNGSTLVHRSNGEPGEDTCQIMCNKTLVCTELQIPLMDPNYVPSCTLVGSIDGLLLLTPTRGYGKLFYLYNPSIQRFKKIYDSCLYKQFENGKNQVIVGLGFCRNGDYRILRVFYSRIAIGGEEFVHAKSEIYSIRSGYWHLFRGDFPKNLSSLETHSLVILNGRSHWLKEDSKSVVTFDFDQETFGDVSLPDFNPENKETRLFLDIIKGKLALIVCSRYKDPRGAFSIWGLMEYGVVQSWTKLYYMEPIVIVRRPLGFTLEGQLILELIYGDLVSYDLEEEFIRSIGIRRRPDTILDIVPYVESLVFYDEGITGFEESSSEEESDSDDADWSIGDD